MQYHTLSASSGDSLKRTVTITRILIIIIQLLVIAAWIYLLVSEEQWFALCVILLFVVKLFDFSRLSKTFSTFIPQAIGSFVVVLPTSIYMFGHVFISFVNWWGGDVNNIYFMNQLVSRSMIISGFLVLLITSEIFLLQRLKTRILEATKPSPPGL